MNAILLAGGKSSRYGGNKALINLQGEAIIKKMIMLLNSVFERVYVVGNSRSDYSFLEGVVLLEDIVAGKGPLGGLYTGLAYSDADDNYLMACDMPFITDKYLNFMLNYRGEYDILVPEYRGFLEPLAAVYRSSCLPFIADALAKDNLKIKSFFPAVKLNVIKEEKLCRAGDPARLFFNINYKGDLQTVKALLEVR